MKYEYSLIHSKTVEHSTLGSAAVQHPTSYINGLSEKEKIRLAKDKNTSKAFFKTLTQSKNYSVKEALIENHALPADLLYDLAQDRDPDVRYLIASDPYIPGGILRDLASDDNPYIAARAQRTIDRIELDVSRRRNYRDCLLFLKTSQFGMVS